jgi:hypothetical protein
MDYINVKAEGAFGLQLSALSLPLPPFFSTLIRTFVP